MGEVVAGGVVVFGALVWLFVVFVRFLVGRKEFHVRVAHEDLSANHQKAIRLLDNLIAYDDTVAVLPKHLREDAQQLINDYYDKVV